ncbi:MAG: PadR family transcriptional regulator [Candidatus Thorarchaeota archaeon]|jgi:DNA-binding PadR family transcriptional regulator
MRKDDLVSKLLEIIGYEEIHGYELYKEISFRGSKVSQSRIYGILADMVSNGLLNEQWESSKQGPRRKLFSLTETGLEHRMLLLIDAVNSVHRFYVEYLGRLPTDSNFFDQIWSTLKDKVPTNPRLAVLIGHISQPAKYLLSQSHNHFSEGVFYILKNQETELEDVGENWLIMDGIYDNIPLKDEYLDLLLVVGFHSNFIADAVVQEWYRMIKKNGTLAVLTPAIQTFEPKTPLSLGDFIEFHQHQNHGTHEDWITFKKLITAYSSILDETVMADVCLFQARK